MWPPSAAAAAVAVAMPAALVACNEAVVAVCMVVEECNAEAAASEVVEDSAEA